MKKRKIDLSGPQGNVFCVLGITHDIVKEEKREERELNIVHYLVYPSKEYTIQVEDDNVYGGAHKYIVNNCIGFNNGNTEYVESVQEIQFVQKNEDGSVIPGLQSEQLVWVLIDRVLKLNKRFPCEENIRMLEGLEIFIQASEDRVKNRMQAGSMGKLQK